MCVHIKCILKIKSVFAEKLQTIPQNSRIYDSNDIIATHVPSRVNLHVVSNRFHVLFHSSESNGRSKYNQEFQLHGGGIIPTSVSYLEDNRTPRRN